MRRRWQPQRSCASALKLSALFGGKVKMTEIALIDPVIALPRTPATRGS